MKLLELLKGKKIMVTTDVGVMVELEIAEVIDRNFSENLEEPNPANDWWPKTRDWTTYTIKFTNGYSKDYPSLDDINFN